MPLNCMTPVGYARPRSVSGLRNLGFGYNQEAMPARQCRAPPLTRNPVIDTNSQRPNMLTKSEVAH